MKEWQKQTNQQTNKQNQRIYQIPISLALKAHGQI